ncbi:GTPase RsgA, partial [Rhodococcus hoagii]|nr:GTPase RsgA [Prescottella equi]
MHGDWAALELGPQPRIVAVLPRRGVIARASVGRTSHRQVMAANVDTACVVVSLAAPIKPGRIERLLALAWDAGTTPLIVLTKADAAECDPGPQRPRSPHCRSVSSRHRQRPHRRGHRRTRAAPTGNHRAARPSGAGKSSLTTPCSAKTGWIRTRSAPPTARDGT